MTISGWIGVDLDGTLAEYYGWKGGDHIGAPVPMMVARVKRWLEEGIEVRIFTARVCVVDAVSGESGLTATQEFADQQRALIEAWCKEHIGQKLKVTAQKDFAMVELWDDRAIPVIMNTGTPMVMHLTKHEK